MIDARKKRYPIILCLCASAIHIMGAADATMATAHRANSNSFSSRNGGNGRMTISRRRSLPFIRNQVVEPPCCFSHPPLMASTNRSSRRSVEHSHSRPSLSTKTATITTTSSLPSATALHSAPIIASLFFRNFWKKKGRRHGHRAATFEGGILAPVKEQHNAPHHVSSLALPSSSYFMDALPLELERELLEVEEHVPVTIPADVALGEETVAFEHPPSALFVENHSNHIDNDEAASVSAVEKDSLSDDDANPRDADAAFVADININQPTATDNDDHNDDPEEIINDNDDHKILIHTYNANADAINSAANNNDINNVNKNKSNDLTLMGVGMPQRQFATWVRYYLLHMTQKGEAMPTPIIPTAQSSSNNQGRSNSNNNSNEEEALVMMKRISRRITTHEVDYENEWDDHVPKVRECWRDGRLICEHTNLLSGSGRSRAPQGEEDEDSQSQTTTTTTTIVEKSEEQLQKEQEEEELRMKSQHFRDVLGSYADRLASIVEDELSEHAHYNMNTMGASGGNDLLQRPYFAEVVDTLTGAHHSRGSNQQSQQQEQQQNLQMAPKWTTENGLRGWIEHEYGLEGTRLLLADTLLRKSEEEQLKTFQAFLDWFRGKFPYFHDKCDSCGASCKDDPLELQQQQQQDGEVKAVIDGSGIETAHHGGEQTNGQADEDLPSININEQDDDNEEDYDYPFLGYVHPTPTELLGNATRTELYHCRSCSSFTRFPRYNRALWVTSALRGRCGEYSMLLYRMLRVLGYGEIRWVVDWADHVWVEVWLGEDRDKDKVGGGGERSESGESSKSDGRWVHLDPCEAAVDNPLLYESWGKNQTYIVAFHDPFYNHQHHVNPGDRDASTTTTAKDDEMERRGASAFPSLVPTQGLHNNGIQLLEREREKRETMLRSRKLPPVEDVTRQYTSDETHVIQDRRGISDEPVAEAIEEVSETMVQLLRSIVDRQ